jgi:HSP20 family protein
MELNRVGEASMSELDPHKTKQGPGEPPSEHEWNPLVRFRRELDSVLDRFWNQWPLWSEELFGRERTWGMGVHDEPDQIVVQADAPGFEADEFDVQISGNQLFITAEHKPAGKPKPGSGERGGKFRRVIPLPPGVEAEKVRARYHNGVLEIHVPKSKAAKGKRIPVKGP